MIKKKIYKPIIKNEPCLNFVVTTTKPNPLNYFSNRLTLKRVWLIGGTDFFFFLRYGSHLCLCITGPPFKFSTFRTFKSRPHPHARPTHK